MESNITEAEHPQAKDDDDSPSIKEKKEESEYDARLDQELQIVRSMRVAMTSLLAVLESARDDLDVLGNRMDRLCAASEKCRTALQKRQQQEGQLTDSRKQVASNRGDD